MHTKTDFRRCERCRGTGKSHAGKLADVFMFINDNGTYKMPVKSKVIEAKFGITGSEVRRLINLMKAEHLPVGSKHDGYYIAVKPEQLDAEKEHILFRIDALFRKLWLTEQIQKDMAAGKTATLKKKDCPDCFGTGEIMVDTHVYDDLITVGGNISGATR